MAEHSNLKIYHDGPRVMLVFEGTNEEQRGIIHQFCANYLMEAVGVELPEECKLFNSAPAGAPGVIATGMWAGCKIENVVESNGVMCAAMVLDNPGRYFAPGTVEEGRSEGSRNGLQGVDRIVRNACTAQTRNGTRNGEGFCAYRMGCTQGLDRRKWPYPGL